jgi:hypothetical protein
VAAGGYLRAARRHSISPAMPPHPARPWSAYCPRQTRRALAPGQVALVWRFGLVLAGCCDTGVALPDMSGFMARISPSAAGS